MRLRDVVRAEKRIADGGRWQSGKMPRAAFPLSKSKGSAYRLGNRRWRVVCFDAVGRKLRLLVNYHAELAQYQAMLGLDDGGDTIVLARFEYHHTHGGWHAHVCCDSQSASPGIKVGPWVKKMAGNCTKYNRDCPDSDDRAYRMAVDIFRLDKLGIGGLA